MHLHYPLVACRLRQFLYFCPWETLGTYSTFHVKFSIVKGWYYKYNKIHPFSRTTQNSKMQLQRYNTRKVRKEQVQSKSTVYYILLSISHPIAK